jgi:hypothetical protein
VRRIGLGHVREWLPARVEAHAAARLDGGRVLVAGGYNCERDPRLAIIEIYDPDTNAWTRGEALPPDPR